MTFFSRCDVAQPFGARVRRPWPGGAALAALAGFAEDLGILFRYAAGLDYYGRDDAARGR